MDKSKYLLPWADIRFKLDGFDGVARRCIEDNDWTGAVLYTPRGWGGVPTNKYWARVVSNDGTSNGRDFDSLEDAQNYVDEKLLVAGYVFLTEEQMLLI